MDGEAWEVCFLEGAIGVFVVEYGWDESYDGDPSEGVFNFHFGGFQVWVIGVGLFLFL